MKYKHNHCTGAVKRSRMYKTTSTDRNAHLTSSQTNVSTEDRSFYFLATTLHSAHYLPFSDKKNELVHLVIFLYVIYKKYIRRCRPYALIIIYTLDNTGFDGCRSGFNRSFGRQERAQCV